jgi:ATP-binding protein involved in chromosome partitioning
MSNNLNREKVLEVLSNVIEPELKKDIVSLNFVSELQIEGNTVSLHVKSANPALHARRRMQEAVEFTLRRILGKEVEVKCEVEGLSKDEQQVHRKVLPGVKNIVAIASGKGGVGKSTVTANLAAGLAKKGFKVGLIDADIYGPSVPLMFDCVHEKPKAVEVDGKQLIEPIESYGVKLLSIGFFADINQAIVWRGPMATKALNQMFKEVNWGELDYLLIDLPPGTGDVHLTIVQVAPLTGALIVTTPQEVALADARKGVAMFRLDSVQVPVLGIVENMSWFTPAELPENKYYIFGKDGAKGLAEQLEVKLLGQLPLVQSIREAGDAGRPAVLQFGTPTAKAFEELVDAFVQQVNWRNEHLPPTQLVETAHPH